MALTKVIGDGIGSVGDDLSLVSDGSIVNFGVNSEISLTHVHNSGLTLASSVGATTFKIGRAGATDAKVIFDGNAQNYHIGVDDTNDSLVIGLGDTLGTTDSMVINAAGIITKPLQPAFQAKPASDQTNIAVGTEVNILFGTEIFDNNADYDGSFIFTAPVTGKYHFSGVVRLGAVDAASEYYIIRLRTSNRDRDFIFDSNEFSSDLDYVSFPFAITTDMDAGDQAYMRYYQNSGTAQTDVDSSSVFSGHLVC
tara:strand:+ start:23 stop:781 length:759 start_codon:yes stop_codon:yes gene_type:complete